MIKESIYNIYLKENDEVLLYNSLSKNYVKFIDKNNKVEELFDNPTMFCDSEIFIPLTEGGFLVDERKDEIGISNLRYYEKIFNPTLEICIMPTEQCNFRCVYCYENFKVGNMTHDTMQNFLNWFDKTVRNYQKVHIHWFGGEPLVAIDNIRFLSKGMLDISRKYKKPYVASITTNGYLLNYDLFKELLSYKVVSYQITIDGSKINHDRNRILKNGKGTYSNIVNNLKEISSQSKSNIYKIIIRTNVTNTLLDLLPQYIEEMSKDFGSDERFGFYFRPVGKWGNKDISIKEQELLNNFSDLYSTVLNCKYKLNYNIYRDMLDDQICFAQNRNQYVIRADGRVAKCTMLLESEENDIGKLDSHGMKLDEEKMEKWIAINKHCDSMTCKLYPVCHGRTCPAKGYILNNNSVCGYEGLSVEYILRLLNKTNTFRKIGELL